MQTPIDAAKNLKSLLERVGQEIPMAGKWKKSIEGMAHQCDEMIAQLEHIHNEIVPLDLQESNKQHAVSFEFFKSLPGGRIEVGQPEYERLFTQSATLNELYRAGFEMPSMLKFSDGELAFAKEIGEGFRDWNGAWRGFMLASQHGETFRQIKAGNGGPWEPFLNLLKRHKVIESFSLSVKNIKSNVFVKTHTGRLRYLPSNHSIRFDWEKGDSHFDSLISGHWFSAFAFSIIVDHLERLGSDYETYTLVRYSAPKDVIRSSGDFDVIARTGRKILMVECKSGALKPDRDDISLVIEKAEDLRGVFTHAHSEIVDYSFWLIYNPYLNESADVLKALEGSGIKAVRPEDIRGEVRRCFETSPKAYVADFAAAIASKAVVVPDAMKTIPDRPLVQHTPVPEAGLKPSSPLPQVLASEKQDTSSRITDVQELKKQLLTRAYEITANSQKPVGLAGLGHQLRKEFGAQVIETQWAGEKRMQNLIKHLELRGLRVTSEFLFDPKRHETPTEKEKPRLD